MTNPTPHGQAPAIQRYKIGYHSDEWGQRSSTPSGIPDASGPWVRYKDHITALKAAQPVVVQDDLITIRKPTTSAEMLLLLNLAHLVISDVNKELEAAFAPAQPQADRVPAVDEAYKQAVGSKNCMQCCVSYMLGLPLESVPDFATDGGWERFSEFVESKGYAAVMLPGNREFEADYLASGTTERGTSHMVVMNDGKLVHDPHPSNAGIFEVQCVWLLTKKATPQGHHDERAAFEASAKAYTSNVSFERDEHDYADMTASLLWHGWKLRAARDPADSVLEDAARRTTGQEHAIRQGHEIAASDGYFEARPQIDSNDRRKVFQAGFERGWDAARKQGANHD